MSSFRYKDTKNFDYKSTRTLQKGLQIVEYKLYSKYVTVVSYLPQFQSPFLTFIESKSNLEIESVLGVCYSHKICLYFVFFFCRQPV